MAKDAVTSLSAHFLSVFAFVASGELIRETAKSCSITLNEYKNPVEIRSHSKDVCLSSLSNIFPLCIYPIEKQCSQAQRTKNKAKKRLKVKKP